MWDRRAKRRVHLSPWRKRPRRHSRKATSLAQVETDRPEGLRMRQIYSVLLNSPALKWMSWPRRQSICQGRLKLTGTGFSFASFYISEVQPCHEASCTSDVIHIEGHCGRFLSRPCVFFFLARLKLSAVMIVLFELLGGKGWLGARGCPFFFLLTLKAGMPQCLQTVQKHRVGPLNMTVFIHHFISKKKT